MLPLMEKTTKRQLDLDGSGSFIDLVSTCKHQIDLTSWHVQGAMERRCQQCLRYKRSVMLYYEE